MTKEIIVILPNEDYRQYFIEDNLNYFTLENNVGTKLGMPVESFSYKDKEYFIAKCHDNISDLQIEDAITKFHP